MVENDCEDQGFSLISDGCSKCRTDEVVRNKAGLEVLKPVALVKRDGYWCCPVCNGSYGAVNAA